MPFHSVSGVPCGSRATSAGSGVSVGGGGVSVAVGSGVAVGWGVLVGMAVFVGVGVAVGCGASTLHAEKKRQNMISNINLVFIVEIRKLILDLFHHLELRQ